VEIRMRIPGVLAVCLLFATPVVAGPSAADTIPVRYCEAGVPFAPATAVAGHTIPLRNAALLEFLGLDVYSAAVYVPDGAVAVDDVLDSQPKTLEIYYHRALGAEQINRATERALARNPTVDAVALAAQLEQLYAAARDVADGDRYRAHHVGGVVTLELNGEVTAVIEGDDFARAFFGIWLSEHALSDSLRDRLLAAAD
jgi:hypothetical protein